MTTKALHATNASFLNGEFPKNSRIALLSFQDGSFIPGYALGESKTAIGELVFNTSMTGYQEALTDPSYAGQILTFTYPLIGNYGFSKTAFESQKIHALGAVVHEACTMPIHYNSQNVTLDEFLQQQNAPGIAGVDTRAITLRIREHGVLPAGIRAYGEGELKDEKDCAHAAQELANACKKFDYASQNYVELVSPKSPVQFGSPDAKKHVVLVDCGAKAGIAHNLTQRGARVTAVPWNYSSKQIFELEPDGIMLSNGPGDPALLKPVMQTCRELLGKKPIFGICLGNQILGHALGANTYKLKFGHRGCNHPAIHKDSQRVFITSQNHGFAVGNLPSGVEPLYENAYDGSNEGLKCAEKIAFSVQFHPEARPGPQDTSFLFDDFLEML